MVVREGDACRGDWADCAALESGREMSRAGVSEDFLQDNVKTVRRIKIIVIELFMKNLSLLMGTPVDNF